MKKILILIRLMLIFVKRKNTKVVSYDKIGQSASDYIKQLLESDKPVMIARFGSVELQCVVDSIHKPTFRNCLSYITHKTDSLGYGKSTRYTMGNNAGFFPVTDRDLDRFSQLMINCMPLVDVLGVWQKNELIFATELSNAVKVPLGDLEPYFHANPWSTVLEQKKVLVIHPFEESIREQYKKRELLFNDKRVLPEFDLQIIKAVQSIAGNPTGFTSWFDALEYMKGEIDKRDFDIAIIGCGAYGFPLAAYVKSIGKKAVHLGGATQMLFGIKSKSWEDDSRFHYLINEHWIRPKETERPANYKQVEGGRYW
ncbi:MAG: hypothetical protein VB126_11100 [Paludibacter sp.]|nr:hypothetical protein [Paludibacter sp.]